MVTQLIREAWENKGDLVVLWMDLANAYGSIPHKLEQLQPQILCWVNNFRMA